MKIQQVTGKATGLRTDLVALCRCEDGDDRSFDELDKATGGRISERLKEEQFTGKRGQSVAIDTRDQLPSRWVLVIGAGPSADLAPSSCRDLAATAIKESSTRRVKEVAFVLPQLKAAEKAVHFATLGASLSLYRFDKYKTSDDDVSKPPKRLQIVLTKERKQKAAETRALGDAIKGAQAVAGAICRARDLVNEPADALTPTAMAEMATKLANKHPQLKTKVLGKSQCEKLGMGMYLAVARGSSEPCKLIHMTYTPKKKGKKTRKVALIGKGVTFDSGGYSLKPAAAMEDMKIDMAGAAAVLSAMEAVAKIGPNVEVHAVAACCENMVSGGAYKLGDVLQSMDGTTVEINNTDAEGRLTLGDAITYVRTRIKPDEIIDFATLTGACMVALGPHTAAVMSKQDDLADKWLGAAEEADEKMWRLPLQDELKEQLKSNIADLRNTGERWGGAITAGLFLAHFAKDSRWLHVDLAGPASTSKEGPAISRGGTGFAVATIVSYLRD